MTWTSEDTARMRARLSAASASRAVTYAVTDVEIAALLDHVERLEAEVARLRGHLGWAHGFLGGPLPQCGLMRTERYHTVARILGRDLSDADRDLLP